jgi:hypothetical protein
VLHPHDLTHNPCKVWSELRLMSSGILADRHLLISGLGHLPHLGG